MTHGGKQERRTLKRDVTIASVSGQDMSLVSNMIQRYLHEKSPYHDLQIDVDGNYASTNLLHYFTNEPEAGYEAAIIMVDGTKAGIVLMNRNTLLDGSSRRRSSVFDRGDGHPDTNVAILSIFPRYRDKGSVEDIMNALVAYRHGTWEALYDDRDSVDRSIWDCVGRHHQVFSHDMGDHKVVVELTT